MMNWISKLLHQSASPSGAGTNNLADVVADRKRLLAEHIKIQIDKAKSHSQLVPGDFASRCQRLFADHLDDMAQKVARSELCGDVQNIFVLAGAEHGYDFQLLFNQMHSAIKLRRARGERFWTHRTADEAD